MKEDSNSIANQKKILSQYAQDNGFKNTSFFVDDGGTGISFDRPAFMEINQNLLNTIVPLLVEYKKAAGILATSRRICGKSPLTAILSPLTIQT